MSSTSESSTPDLLHSYRAGDASALDALLAKHRDWLWSYVSRHMGDHLRAFEASEDVVQDVLRALIERGPAFVPADDGQFRRLAATLVLNRLRDRNDYARAACRDRALEATRIDGQVSRLGAVARSVDQPARQAERREQVGHVALALDLMPPDDAHVIRRRRWDGASFQEIGSELGISDDAAQKRHVRAMTRLGGLLKKLEKGDLSFLPDPLEDGAAD